MIEIRLLTFHYPGTQPLFADFSLTINRGEAWTIIGPSGCGKTTLLYMLAGLRAPAQGGIYIDGEVVTRPRPATGLVLQDHGLLPWETVWDNARLGLKIRAFYGPDGTHSPADMIRDPEGDDQRVRHWLRWLGIDGCAAMYPGQLSRGQRQRAAIARTLALEPDFLLMDEPFSALDAPIRAELQNVMHGFHLESGLTSVTVTHDIEEALILGEKILVLDTNTNSVPRVVNNELGNAEERRLHPEFGPARQRLQELLGQPARSMGT